MKSRLPMEKRNWEMARRLGGKWAADVKLWYIEYGRIKGTELEKHIVLDASKKNSGQ